MTAFFPSSAHKVIYGSIAFAFAYLTMEYMKSGMFFLALPAFIGLVFMGLPSTIKSLSYQRRIIIGVPLAGLLSLVKLLLMGL